MPQPVEAAKPDAPQIEPKFASSQSDFDPLDAVRQSAFGARAGIEGASAGAAALKSAGSTYETEKKDPAMLNNRWKETESKSEKDQLNDKRNEFKSLGGDPFHIEKKSDKSDSLHNEKNSDKGLNSKKESDFNKIEKNLPNSSDGRNENEIEHQPGKDALDKKAGGASERASESRNEAEPKNESSNEGDERRPKPIPVTEHPPERYDVVGKPGQQQYLKVPGANPGDFTLVPVEYVNRGPDGHVRGYGVRSGDMPDDEPQNVAPPRSRMRGSKD